MKNKKGVAQLHRIVFWAGFLAVFAMLIPFLILGEDSAVIFHDQLDGELIAYILQARHLFDRGGVLPEFLGGAGKTALTPPAPLAVLLFLPGKYFGALTVLQMAGSLTGYVGMYLLAKRFCDRPVPAVLAALAYAYLPFEPVYGLSHFGLPLLCWFFLELSEGRHRAGAFVYGAVFALNSSLVLVGFAVLASAALWLIGRSARERSLRRSFWGWLLLGELLVLYLLENLSLLGQILFGAGTASHKEEYALNPAGFWEVFPDSLFNGRQHSLGYQKWLVFACAGVVAIALLFFRKEEGRRVRTVGTLFLWNFVFALIAGFWACGAGILLRSRLGVLRAFQLDRCLWIAPMIWYVLFACCGAMCSDMLRAGFGKKGAAYRCLAAASGVLLVAGMCVTGFRILRASTFKLNVQILRNPDYGAMRYNEYYADGVMEQVEAFLREQTGMRQEEYRVVSLGIDPAAALYHGFYCLDGYSNNYDLSYKHRFRAVIAPELEKNDYLKSYFDGWGNRCYLYSAEAPGNYRIAKGTMTFGDYEVDAEALYALGAGYLLSAARIEAPERTGLVLMREEPFDTPESYYEIYLYQVCPDAGEKGERDARENP